MRKWSVGFGTGVNYFNFEQKSDVYSDITYKSLKMPSYVVMGRAHFNETHGIEASYAIHPGEIKGGAGVNNIDSAYEWRHMTLEWLYRTRTWPYFLPGQTRSETYLRMGGQYHVLPYYEVSSTQLNLKSRSIGMASLGYEYFAEFLNKYRAQIYMRYQYPLFPEGLRGNSPRIKPKFAFDGSIGGQYRMTDDWNIGIFWYGQWHVHSFPIDAGDGSQDFYQSLFFSNLEVNLAYDF